MVVGLLAFLALVRTTRLVPSADLKAVVSFAVMTAAGFAVLFKFTRAKSLQGMPQQLGFTRVNARWIAAAIAIGGLVWFLCWLLTFQMYGGHFSFMALTEPTGAAIVLMLTPLILEEPLLRGFVYKAMRNRYSVVVSTTIVVVCSLLFHTGNFVLVPGFISLIVFEFVLCVLRERAGSLWPSIACHTTYNVLFGLIQPLHR